MVKTVYWGSVGFDLYMYDYRTEQRNRRRFIIHHALKSEEERIQREIEKEKKGICFIRLSSPSITVVVE